MSILLCRRCLEISKSSSNAKLSKVKQVWLLHALRLSARSWRNVGWLEKFRLELKLACWGRGYCLVYNIEFSLLKHKVMMLIVLKLLLVILLLLRFSLSTHLSKIFLFILVFQDLKCRCCSILFKRIHSALMVLSWRATCFIDSLVGSLSMIRNDLMTLVRRSGSSHMPFV